jgi:hypothetical protein
VKNESFDGRQAGRQPQPNARTHDKEEDGESAIYLNMICGLI